MAGRATKRVLTHRPAAFMERPECSMPCCHTKHIATGPLEGISDFEVGIRVRPWREVRGAAAKQVFWHFGRQDGATGDLRVRRSRAFGRSSGARGGARHRRRKP